MADLELLWAAPPWAASCVLEKVRQRRGQENAKGLAYYHYLKAQQLLLAEDAPGAIQEYEAALEEDPSSASMELELAFLYQRQGDIKKALAHVEKALKAGSQAAGSLFSAGRLHVGLNQLEEAIQEYEHILALDPENREARLFLATLYAQQRRFPKAIRTIQEILRLEPQSVVGHYYLGRFYLETDKLAEAKKEFNRTLSLDPKFVPAMFDLAVALEREKQYQPGPGHVSPGLAPTAQQHPGLGQYRPGFPDPEPLRGRPEGLCQGQGPGEKRPRGQLQYRHHQPGTETRRTTPSRNFGPCSPIPVTRSGPVIISPWPWRKRGISRRPPGSTSWWAATPSNSFRPACGWPTCSISKGTRTGPGKSWKRSGNWLRTGKRSISPASYFYEEENLWDRAIGVLKEGMGKVERPGEIYFRLAVIYEKKQDRDESIAYIKKVLELDPDNPDAQNFLGYTYAEQGINLDEAERLIRAALQAKPNSGHIIDSLGWVFFKKGQYDKAAVELERAHHLMPQDGTVTEHLADAYYRLKRYREALRLYRKAAGLENPNPTELRKKINNLELLLRERSL